MIAESLVIIAVLLGGSLVVRTIGLRGWPVPAVGYALGIALLVVLTAVPAIIGLAVAPWLPVLFTALGSALLWAWRAWCGDDVRLSIRGAGAVLALALAFVAVFRAANLVNLTPDSYRYLSTGGLLASGRLEEASSFLLESRLLAVPAMHAPAALSDDLYLRSVTPLLGISCVLILAWLVRSGLRARGCPGSRRS